MKKIMGLLMMMGLMVSFVGCGKDTPTGASEEITEGPQGQPIIDMERSSGDSAGNMYEEEKWSFYLDEDNKRVKHGYYYLLLATGDGSPHTDGIVIEGNYKAGEKVGKWVEYDEEGNITDEDIWENGECVESCEGDEEDE